jgi:hypothetical protein
VPPVNVQPCQVLMQSDGHFKCKEGLQKSPSGQFVCMSTYHVDLPDFKHVLVNTVSVVCLFYPVSYTTFCKLVDHPSPFNAITDSSAPMKADLIFHPNGHATYGAFKRARLGDTSIPIFRHSTTSTRTRVCIKQCWYKCKVPANDLSTITILKLRSLALKSTAYDGPQH